MGKYVKKFRLWAVIALVVVSSMITLSFIDSDFEIAKNLEIYSSMIRELNLNYVDEINPGELTKTGIDAMLKSLDPYTNYIAESDLEDYKFMTTGQYGGIGALIHKQGDYVVISDVYEGFPAQKAGVIAGDKIISVNGNNIKGKSTGEVSKFLKGQAGSEALLKVIRLGEDEPIDITVDRETVTIDNIPYYGMLNEEVGYILLTGFTQHAGRDVRNAFLELKDKQGMKKIIFDLRGNGGGLLNEAVNILNIFIDKGQVVVSTKGKVTSKNRAYRTYSAPVDLAIPIVILVDGSSASASEIVSGAIQDLDRGVIIGQRTFGKGLVQNIVPLSYNTKMKVTISKYYIPSGRCIQAIDYSHRNKKGKAEGIPDSLKTAFKTSKGRTVYDGKGIKPDVVMDAELASNIEISLVSKFLIFDYANQFKLENDSIPTPEKFEISTEEYAVFVDYLSDKEYDYTTKSERRLEAFKEASENETYYEDIEAEYKELYDKIIHNKNEDLKTFDKEVKSLLKNEIISRYYYQKGRIQTSLSDDPEIKKAIDVLQDTLLYDSILDGTYVQVEEKSE